MKAGDVVSIVSNTLSGVVTVLGVLADQMNKKRERRAAKKAAKKVVGLSRAVGVSAADATTTTAKNACLAGALTGVEARMAGRTLAAAAAAGEAVAVAVLRDRRECRRNGSSSVGQVP
ncbi:MAG: hypothetical protein M1815_005015 [Lichina confinis]|nr:MAG: hypothetical protein M1815_005015 [Lichina confinis]